jgi:hypothetical protein
MRQVRMHFHPHARNMHDAAEKDGGMGAVDQQNDLQEGQSGQPDESPD